MPTQNIITDDNIENTTNTTTDNDYSLEPIPEHSRRTWVGMFLTLMAIGVDLSSVILGTELSNAMPVGTAISAVLFGSLCAAFLYTACSLVGANTKLSTAMITEHVFGKLGGKLFALVIGISLLGWFGVQLGFFADNAHIILKSMFNMDVSVQILSAIGGFLMLLTAISGYRALEKLSVFSVPFLVALMMVTLAMALNKNGLPATTEFENPMTFMQGVSFAISIIIVGAIVSPDIGRWAKTKKDCMISSFFGVILGNSFMIVVSILLMKSFNNMDIMNLFMVLGLGIPGVIVLTLAQWTTNTSNIYSSSLGFSVIFKKIAKLKITLALGFVGTALAVLGIYDKFIDFLMILSIAVAPVGGIYVCEYYLVKKRLVDVTKTTKKADKVTLTAWLIGTTVSYFTTYGYMTLTTLPPMDGFIAGMLALLVLEKSLASQNKSEQESMQAIKIIEE